MVGGKKLSICMSKGQKVHSKLLLDRHVDLTEAIRVLPHDDEDMRSRYESETKPRESRDHWKHLPRVGEGMSQRCTRWSHTKTSDPEVYES